MLLQKIENIRRDSYPFKDGWRKCLVTLDAWIDGKKYETDGEFAYGPDMTENKACSIAEQRAKESIIKKVSPEMFSSRTDMICSQNNIARAPSSYTPGTAIPIDQFRPNYAPAVPYVFYDNRPPEVQVIKQGGIEFGDAIKWGLGIFSIIRR